MEPSRVAAAGTSSEQSSQPDLCTIHICPTTGGDFHLNVPSQDTIDSLKKAISQRLKLSKERISLLFKDRILKEGSVAGNGLYEGCRLTLLPHVESGLISQRNENSVMQALENLTESQVNDFLSGKAPLTLAMRLGDHMMFVQLQLSTSAPSSKHRSSSSSTSKSSSSSASASTSSSRQSASPSLISSLPSSLPSLLSSRPAKVLPSPIPIKPTPVFPVSPSSTSSSTCSSPASSAPPSPVSPVSSGFSSGPPSPTSSTSSFCSPLPSPVAKSPADSDSSAPPSPTSPSSPISVPVLDSSALAQASRNLSQKLRELSQASTQNKDSREKSTSSLRSSSGAVIESMYHHGQGVFSGTFSGTLNPALQDTDGKPRRSVSTIVHILNDLLGATPQYRARVTPKSKMTHRLQSRASRHHHLLPSASPAVRKSSRSSAEQMQMNSENIALKGKVEHIQQMLEERRRRLRARRQARSSPYPACWSDVNCSEQVPSGLTHQPMEVDTPAGPANHTDTHPDNSSYTQIKQEPVMA